MTAARPDPCGADRGRVCRFTRRFFYACVAITLVAALSAHVAHGPYDISNEGRNFLALLLLPALLTVMPIPVVYLVLLILAKGYRSAIVLYVVLGMFIWYVQMISLSFEFSS